MLTLLIVLGVSIAMNLWTLLFLRNEFDETHILYNLLKNIDEMLENQVEYSEIRRFIARYLEDTE